MPIWSMRWRPAAPQCRRRSPAAPRCRARSRRRSPKSAPPEACLVLLENPDADIAPFSIDRIVERFGHLAAIREALLARDDIPAATRQTLVTKLSETLAGFVAGRAWLDADHAQRIAREACEKATVTIAAETPETRAAPAGPAFVRQRPTHRRPDSARAVVRQCRAVRGGAGRTGRHAGRARLRPHSRPRQRGLARAVRQRRNCRRRPIPPSRRRSRRCAKAASATSRAAPRGSSGA